MGFVRIMPLLAAILVILLVGLVAWGFWRSQSREVGGPLMKLYDDVSLGFLVLAVLALVAFIAYVFWGFTP